MMRVRGGVRVTLQTRRVSAVACGWLQLVVRPLRDDSPIVRGLMHRVTRRAGQGVAIVFRVLVARRLEQRVVLAPGGAHHAIGPEDVANESRVVLKEALHD